MQEILSFLWSKKDARVSRVSSVTMPVVVTAATAASRLSTVKRQSLSVSTSKRRAPPEPALVLLSLNKRSGRYGASLSCREIAAGSRP